MSYSLTLICLILNAVSKLTNALQCNDYRNCSVDPALHRPYDTNRFTSRIPVWLESCNCDPECYSFGDCCSDVPSLAANPLKDWSILTVRISPKFTYSVLMKTKCPDDWQNRKVRQMCESIGFKESEEYFVTELSHLAALSTDEFLLWQVTSRSTLITYRNIYCALCNNDTRLEAWTHNIKCSDTTDGRKCSTVSYQIPPDFMIEEKVKRRPVQIQIQSSCNVGWYKANVRADAERTIEVVKNCSLFYAPVVVEDNQTQRLTAFKNEFCAQCSGYNESQLLCPSQSNNFFEHQKPRHFDTSVSFDTDFESGGRIPGQNSSCASGQVYNPFENKCRVIVIDDTDDEEMSDDSEDNKDVNQVNDETVGSGQSAVHSVESNASPAKRTNKSNKIVFICLAIVMNLVSN